MGKAEISTNQVDGNDRTLKGLVDKGLVDFKCADCGKHLLVLQLTDIEGSDKNDSGDILTRVAVKCGSCNGFSYVRQISGQFHPGAPSDKMAFDVLDDETGAPEADVLFRAWSK